MRPKHFWIGAGVALGVLFILFAAFCVQSAFSLELDKITRQAESTLLFDASKEEKFRLASSENRTRVKLSQIPQPVINAFIAAEDARFYNHFGIDVYRIGGALVKNIETRDFTQGASTITQQLVKLTHLSNEKTIVRKLREACMALRLETLMSKDDILENYLNTVYFGAGAYGIEAASQAYFSKPAAALSVEEGALLAAIIKSPSNYAPHLKPDDALRRRNVVLDEMADNSFLTESSARALRETPIELKRPPERGPEHAWALDAICAEAEKILGISPDELITGGYRVYSSFIPAMQTQAEELFKNGKLFPGDATDGTPAQSALISLDTRNGEILSVIGGREYLAARALNRATQTRRQPGSALKPISVYAAAIDHAGMLPSDFVEDTQRDFGNGYSPKNSGDTYHGTVTLRDALARSMNVASVDLITKVGVNAALDYAIRAGLPLDQRDANLSLAVGSLTGGVSPAELCAAFAPLSNGGSRVVPHLVRRITDAQGKVLYEFRAEHVQVMSKESAYILTDILMDAADWGTARALKNVPVTVAAKTGTVGYEGGGNRDAWTIAYTPAIAICSWMGFDSTNAKHHLSNAISGGSLPAQLLAEYFGKLKLKGKSFDMPNGLREVLLDEKALTERRSVMLAGEFTPSAYTAPELFPINRLPTRVSDAWRKPSTVFDLNAEMTEKGVLIRFTSLDSNALYRLERDGTVIAELKGEAGEALGALDPAGTAENGYSVTPYSAEHLKDGVELAGNPSTVVRCPRGSSLMELIFPGEARPEPTPAPTQSPPAQPSPTEKPLFG